MSASTLVLILTPVISGLIGWFTNWIAVLMLFKPEKPVNLGFMKLQGIFPKRQRQLAERIGHLVASELLTSHDIRDRLMNEENLVGLKLYIEEKVDDYLHNKFPSRYPLTSVFFGRGRRERIKVDLLEEVDALAPDVIERIFTEMEAKIDVEHIITQKVEKLSPAALEKLIKGILKKEFVFIEWIGGILGFLIGVIQVLLIVLTR